MTLEQQAINFLKTSKEAWLFEGAYSHKSNGYLIYVLRSTPKYVILKWGESEVVRSISFMNDYEKLEKSTIH